MGAIPTEPTLGLFDLPTPLLQALDDAAATLLPGVVRVILWGALSAWVSMALYRRWSDQGCLQAIKGELAALRRELAGYDGPFDGLRQRVGRALRLSGQQMRLSLLPALAGSVPLLFLLVWLSNTYGPMLPAPGAAIAVHVPAAVDAAEWQWRTPHGAPARVETQADGWRLKWPGAGRALELVDSQGRTLLELPLDAATEVLHPPRWWNWLLANPGGYLPADSPLPWVRLELPARELIGFGPSWLRGWAPVYFTALIFVSLYLRRRWRLQ